MKSVQVLSIFFVLGAFALADEIKNEEGVLVLNKNNFDEGLQANEFILVEFYAPWCGHCKALAPEYEAAAKSLAEQNSLIKLAKVDATENQELAEQYGVRGYPTLKFFKHTFVFEYTGGRKADEIVSWLLKKTGPPAKNLGNVEEAKAFVEGEKVAVIGFFKDQDSDLAKSYLHIAADIDDIPFGVSADSDVFANYEVADGSILLFKKFDDEVAKYDGGPEHVNLRKFVTVNALPLLIEFNHESAQKIFGGEIKNHLLLFLNKGADDYGKITDAARSIAKSFRDNVLFVTIDASEEDHQRILDFFGMKPDEVPAARLIKLADEMAKYKPNTNELTAESLNTFVQNFLDGKLKQHLLSQSLPEDWDKQEVKVLVSENFENVALDKEKDVLVEFYAPWCGHCKQLVPIYEKIGDHFKRNDDVVIAKIDSTANELEDIKIISFPTIKLFKKESNDVVDYTGPRTFEALVKFIESGGQEGAEDEAPEEPEDDNVKDEL